MEKKTEMLGIKITPTTKKALEKLSKEKERSLSFLANKAIEEYIKKETSPN